MLNKELADIFKYEPGMDINDPIPLKSVTDKELAMDGVEIQVYAKWENGIENP